METLHTLLGLVLLYLIPLLLAGTGAVLSMVGYRLVSFHSQWTGIFSLAMAGFLGGVLLDSQALAFLGALAGGVTGYAGRSLFRTSGMLCFAFLCGALVGTTLSLIFSYSSPRVLVLATGTAFTILAMLDLKGFTAFLTSITGAALLTIALGITTLTSLILKSLAGTGPEPSKMLALAFASPYIAFLLFLCTSTAGFLFQYFGNRPKPAPGASPLPASTV